MFYKLGKCDSCKYKISSFEMVFYMMHVITCIQIQNDIASDLIIGEEGVSFCESTD